MAQSTGNRIWKRPSEEVWFYHQFKRTPAPGWIKTGESISSITSITIIDTDTEEDCSGDMLLDSVILEDTKVGYKVGGGEGGKSYEVQIVILTTNDETFEDHVDLDVISS